MASRIIGDAKFQQLSMSFSFDEQHEDKLIVNALADHTPYQLELFSNLELDFQDFKNALLSKQFKLVSKSPEILKIKIAFASFEFKNVENMTINSLKEIIDELSNKFKQQSQKNTFYEDRIKQFRNDFDLITTQIADLRCINQEGKLQFIQVKKEIGELKHECQKLTTKTNELKMEVHESKKEIESLRKELSEGKEKNEAQGYTITAPGEQIKKESDLIEGLRHVGVEKFMKWQKEMNTERYKHQLRETQIQKKSIQMIEIRLEQIEKVEFTQKHLQQIKKTKIIKQNSQYKFSDENKSNQIFLSEKNFRATNSSKNYTGEELALVQGVVFKKGSSIRFKIEKIGNGGVAVGLTLRNVVAGRSYKLKSYEHIGHGCIIVFRSGWSYSHFTKEQNRVKTDFSYEVGDVIGVDTNDHELLFVNETKKKEQRLKLNLTEDEWKQACFCVLLNSEQDSISIM